MGTIYTYIGPTGVGYYSTILPALQSASQATGVPLGILEGMALRESTWGQTRYPNFLSLFAGRVPPFTYANIDPNTVSGQALAAARYLANLAQQCERDSGRASAETTQSVDRMRRIGGKRREQ